MANLTGPRGRQERQLPTTPQGQAPLLPHPPFHPSTPRVRVSDSSLMKGWRRRAGEEKRHKKATSNQRMTEKFALSISFPPSTRYRRPCPCKHRNYGPPGISPDPYIHVTYWMREAIEKEKDFFIIYHNFLLDGLGFGRSGPFVTEET